MAITVAELIARIRVEGAAQAQAELARMNSAITRAGTQAQSAGNSLGPGIGKVFNGIANGFVPMNLALHGTNQQLLAYAQNAQTAVRATAPLVSAASSITPIHLSAASATQGLSSSVAMLAEGFGSIAGPVAAAMLIVHGIETAFHLVEEAAKSATEAFVKFTSDAISEAVKIDKYKQTFAGLYDSIEMGEKKVAAIREFGRHSNLSSDFLLGMGADLEAGGINASDRIMKFINVASRGNEEVARVIKDSLIRAGTGGNLGVVMRGLQRTGIGYNDIKAAGIDVSAGHKINATGEEFINAILTVGEKKFPKLGEYLEKSMSTKMVDLQDSWNQLTEAFGKAWFPLLTRIIDSVTPLVNFLTDSGEITKIGAAFAGLFNGITKGDGLVRFLMYVVAIIERIPTLLRNFWTYFQGVFKSLGVMMGQFIGFIVEAIAELGQMIKSLEVPLRNISLLAGAVRDAILASQGITAEQQSRQQLMAAVAGEAHMTEAQWNQTPKETRRKMIADYQAAHPTSTPSTLAATGATMHNGLEKFMAGLPRVGDFFAGISADTDKKMAEMKAYQANPPKVESDPTGTGIFNQNHVAETADATKQTARNTATMAGHMVDFKRFMMGGGDRAKAAVTLSEFYGSAGRGPIHVKVSGAGNEHFQEWLGGVIGETMQGARRGGW